MFYGRECAGFIVQAKGISPFPCDSYKDGFICKKHSGEYQRRIRNVLAGKKTIMVLLYESSLPRPGGCGDLHISVDGNSMAYQHCTARLGPLLLPQNPSRTPSLM